MEELNIIGQAIGSFGFPAAMCLILMKYIKDKDKEHLEEMKTFSETVKNNTIAVLNLTAKLEQFNSKEK